MDSNPIPPKRHNNAKSRDKKMPVLAETTHAVNSAVQRPKVQLFNVSLPTQLQSVLAQIARTFACTGNFIARHPKVLFFCALLPTHSQLHIPPKHVIQKFSSNVLLLTQLQWVLVHAVHKFNPPALHYHLIPTRPVSIHIPVQQHA